MKPRAAWPGLLLAILLCLAVAGLVEWARIDRENQARDKARREWAELERRVRPR